MRQQKRGKLTASGDAFWRFSLAFYARPGVAESLIALQDRAGLDVNLILFALWRGLVHGHRLDAAGLGAAEAAVAPLRRELVVPLRQLRRRLKDESDPDLQGLRRQLAALELAAERRAQNRLAATVAASDTGGDPRAAATANLAFCLGAERKSPDAAILRQALLAFTSRG